MRRVTLYLFVIALAARIIMMIVFDTWHFAGRDDQVRVGETSSIAASIAAGRGFAAPFGNGPMPEYTGPTAWIAPAYPYLIAGIFKVFGVFTPSSAAALFVLQLLFSALTVFPIIGIAGRMGNRRAGYLAAVTWAVFPWFAKWALTWEWEVSLSALLASLLIWAVLAESSWVMLGLLQGAALLVNPALAPIGFVCFIWQLRGRWRHAAAATLLALVMITPWLIRNRVVFGRWVFLRSNFGFELYLSNYHNSLGRGWGGRHPAYNPREYADYVRLGETRYVADRQAQALTFIRSNPLEFVILTAKRVAYFWDGSAMSYRTPVAVHWLPGSFGIMSLLLLPGLLIAHRRARGWQLTFGAVLLYPAPYYLTASQVRYRHVLEPLMLVLIAWLFIVITEKLWIMKAK